MTTNESQAELYFPARAGFSSDNDLHRRNIRAQEEWAKSPFVTNAKIQNATIESAKIASLEADKITAGTLTAAITVSGLISAPATTGWRVEIGDATRPIRYWDGGTTRFSLDNAGNVSITGAINATSGTVTGTLLVTGLIQAPAATGYRVEIGNATYPFRYWDGTSSKLRMDTLGNVFAVDVQIDQVSSLPALGLKGANTSGTTTAFRITDSADRSYFEGYNNGVMRLKTPGVSGLGTATFYASDGNKAITTDGRFRAVDGIQTLVGAGANITDADFADAPGNGTLAATNSAGTQRLWVRLAGTWYKTVGLTT